jgi:hypothetical protein
MLVGHVECKITTVSRDGRGRAQRAMRGSGSDKTNYRPWHITWINANGPAPLNLQYTATAVMKKTVLSLHMVCGKQTFKTKLVGAVGSVVHTFYSPTSGLFEFALTTNHAACDLSRLNLGMIHVLYRLQFIKTKLLHVSFISIVGFIFLSLYKYLFMYKGLNVHKVDIDLPGASYCCQ